MRKFGLIGYPLSHSFSPAYFADKFAKGGLTDCYYDAYPIETISRFPDLLAAHPELEGINVTIPYKKAVIPFLDEITDAVRTIGACNCIKIEHGKLIGYNADVVGFQQSLMSGFAQTHKKALILGTGGSAAAVKYVLTRMQIDFISVSRGDATSNKSLRYHDVDEQVLREFTLIINTTPLGMYPAIDDCPDIPYPFLTENHYLFDLVYNPPETLFLKKGKERGARVKNGADMLVLQAEESWRIWNEKIEM